MTAYYNEIDPFCAEWLRNLIKEGLIAPGEVDERDIRDVVPKELMGYRQCHFFAGIGAWSYALRLAGWPDDRPVWTGSCPCQPFSAAGTRSGFADERHLWPSWFHLISVCRPPAIFGEQVASKDGLRWFDLVSSDLENAGYAVGAADLCAAGLGAPQIRQRLWFVAESDSERWKRERLLLRERPKEISETSRSGNFGLLGDSKGYDKRGLSFTPMHREGVETRRSSGACLLADTDSARCNRWPENPQQEERTTTRESVHRQIGRVADSPIIGGETGLCDRQQAEQRGPVTTDDGGSGRVADTDLSSGYKSNTHGRTDSGRQETPGGFELDRKTGVLGYPEAEGLEIGVLPDGRHGVVRIKRVAAFQAGIVGGFWGDADLVLCRDERDGRPDWKYRPVEPGTQPLVTGAPARVGRLRAYGNSIVPQIAAEFIRAYDAAN